MTRLLIKTEGFVSKNRRPAKRQGPASTAELVLDLEGRALAGDPESSFEVPAEEWALLVEFAKRELDARRAAAQALLVASAAEAG